MAFESTKETRDRYMETNPFKEIVIVVVGGFVVSQGVTIKLKRSNGIEILK